MKTKFFLGLIFLFFLPIFFTFTLGQIPEAPASSPTLEDSGVSLRQLAVQRGIQIGAAVNTYPLGNDRTYQQLLAREFNVVVPENAMKFELVHPQQNRFNFQEMDQIIAFAEAHQMEFRHHPLVWDEQLPAWLVRGDFSREELMEILKQHIQIIIKRYRGKVKTIDVVNEGIARDGTLRDTIWLRGIGPEYIDLAFIWAHEADPEAKLFFNEFSAEEMGAKSNAVYDLVQGLQQRGVPIHGVGLQMHKALNNQPKIEEIAQNVARLGELGLEVQITEMDIAIPEVAGADFSQQLQEQAKIYGDSIAMCVAAKNCTAIIFWGFTDRYTWMTSLIGQGGHPLLFDKFFRPKPAYTAVKKALEQ